MNEAVEILLTTCDGAAYLPEQLDSILNQSDDGWHLTVSDDGSRDDTPAIIDDYARRHPDRIARDVHEGRFGNARDHFFHLMGRCNARFMLFCDQDDVWYPEKVKRTREALMKAEDEWGDETPILVFSDQTPTDERLNPLVPSLMRYQKQYFASFDFRSILMQNVVTGGAMGFNRALARMALPQGGDSRIIMHDWWLAAVAARFGKIVYIDEPLGAYRQHRGNAVGAKAVGSAGYVRNRVARLAEVRHTILNKKAQAGAFREAFGDRLTGEDLAFLRAFERPRSGPLFWLKYQKLIHSPVRKIGMLVMC